MSRFITFHQQPRNPGLKTKLWSVTSKKGDPLGMIGWFAAWRRYCFQPDERCVFDPECLRDIATFMEERTTEHKGVPR